MGRSGVRAALVLVFCTGLVVEAGAWTRQSTVTGPRGGTVVRGGSGSCAGGTCSYSGGATGPYGRSYTRSGSATCAGGVCSGSRTVTGPNGNSVVRSRTVTRY